MTIRSELYSVFESKISKISTISSKQVDWVRVRPRRIFFFRNATSGTFASNSRIKSLDINGTNVENHNWAKNGKLFHFQLYISIQLYYYKKSKFLDQLEQKQKVHNDSIVLFSLALHLTIQLYQDLPLKMGRKHKIVPVRIPTVKLKIPGKSMGKAGYQTSVTFKL